MIRFRMPTMLLAVICLIVSPSMLRADSPPAPSKSSKLIWDPEQCSSPETLEELHAFEHRIKQITEKVMPATVGILMGGGAGSGVIVREDGLVLTAAHVISGLPLGGGLRIVLNNGALVEAKTLGYNPKFDSGMVKIVGKPPKDATWPGAKDGKWPYADLGRSDDLKKGQWLILLGQHGGPQQDRKPPLRLARFQNLFNSEMGIGLNTQSTMVGGDSGGPLYDLNGRVVGINSRVNGVFLEMSTHVPIKAFQDEWDKLVAGEQIGVVKKVRIGVSFDPNEHEPTVETVIEGGPADKAGIKNGDTLKKINGKVVETREQALAEIVKLQPGKAVDVEVKRDGETLELKVVPDSDEKKENRKRPKSEPKDEEKPNKKSEPKDSEENKKKDSEENKKSDQKEPSEKTK